MRLGKRLNSIKSFCGFANNFAYVFFTITRLLKEIFGSNSTIYRCKKAIKNKMLLLCTCDLLLLILLRDKWGKWPLAFASNKIAARSQVDLIKLIEDRFYIPLPHRHPVHFDGSTSNVYGGRDGTSHSRGKAISHMTMVNQSLLIVLQSTIL